MSKRSEHTRKKETFGLVKMRKRKIGKMRRSIIIALITFITLITLIFADPVPELIFHDTFEDQKANNYHWNFVGGGGGNQIIQRIDNHCSEGSYCYNFSGNTATYMYNASIFPIEDTMAVQFYVNITEWGANCFWLQFLSVTDTRVVDVFGNGGCTELQVCNAGCSVGQSIPNSNLQDTNKHFKIIYNHTANDCRIYIDGVNEVNFSSCTHNEGNITKIRFYPTQAGQTNMVIDDFKVCSNDCPEAPPPNITFIPHNVTLVNPLNNSVQTDNPLNFTFQFAGFNSSQCIGYFDYPSGWVQFDNITSGTENISVCYNETVYSNETIYNFSSVYGAYRFENDLNDSGPSNFYGTGVGSYSYIPSKGTNATGNYSINFTGGYAHFGNAYGFERTDNFSASAWIRTSYSADYQVIFSKRIASGDYTGHVFFLDYTDSNKLNLWLQNKNANVIKVKGSSTNLANGNWHHVAFTYDGSSSASGVSLYVDGAPETETTISDTLSLSIANAANSQVSGYGGTTSVFRGGIDELYVFDEELTASNITDIYNNGFSFELNTSNTTEICSVTEQNITLNQSTNITLSYSFPTVRNTTINWYVICSNSTGQVKSESFSFLYDNDFTKPSINLLFPTVNDTYNFNLWINLTTDEDAVCVANESFLDIGNSTHHFLSESSLLNQFYSVEVNCTDTSIHSNSAQTYVNFTKDKFYPVINFIFPLEDNSTEFINRYPSSELFTINVTENNDLYSFHANISYFNEFSQRVYVFNETLNVSGVNYLWSRSIALSSYNGTYFMSAKACDSHTKNKIKEAKGIKFDKEERKLKYQFDDMIISLEGFETDLKNIHTTYKGDRYSFDFEYENAQKDRKIILSCSDPLYYRDNTDYAGHFICGNHWIDFEEDDLENIIIESYNNNSYLISISSKTAKKGFKFNSVGELNCITETVEFNTVSERKTYDIELIPGDLFNNNIFDLTTIQGVLVFIFSFLILIAAIVFAEYLQIPIIGVIVGIFGVFYGMLLYAALSAIIGVFVVALAVLYMVISGFRAWY